MALLPKLHTFVTLRFGPFLRDRVSASDIVQSTCREVLEGLNGYRHLGEREFRSWLYRLALRKIADRVEYYQAAKRDTRKESPAALEDDEQLLASCRSLHSPSRDAVAREEVARLERAFEQLPPDYREVILLSRVVGLAGPEVAQQMGRTHDAMRKLLSRALAALAQVMVATPAPKP